MSSFRCGIFLGVVEMKILKIFHFEKFILSNLSSEHPISTADQNFKEL